MVCRESNGKLLAAICIHVEALNCAVVEALALQPGLRLAKAKGWMSLIAKTNSLLVYNSVSSSISFDWKIRGIIDDILSLKSFFPR